MLGTFPCFLYQVVPLSSGSKLQTVSYKHLPCSEVQLHKPLGEWVCWENPVCIHTPVDTAPRSSVSLGKKISLFVTGRCLSVYNLLSGKNVSGVTLQMQPPDKDCAGQRFSACPLSQTRFTDWHREPNASFTSPPHQTRSGTVPEPNLGQSRSVRRY